MDSWQCCRTCLNKQFLQPIFFYPEHCSKYTNVIFTSTGLKVQIDDSLPQQMCVSCITSINENIKFRNRCLEASNVLLQRLENKQVSDIKIKNTNIFKQENDKTVSIDISDFVIDEEFNDYDDNLPLDTLQFNNYKAVEKSEKNEVLNELETQLQDLIEEPFKILHNKRSKSINKEKRKKNRAKPLKKQNGKQTEKEETKSKEETDRVKEEIECEYCHKILTSKLSLRNHYKIHTGFDVVCEHCGKKFITRRLLLMHCRAKHGYEKTDKCSYCDYKASNAEQVKIHERLHTGEKPYVCSQCGAGFHRKSSYLQHVAIHLPEKTIQCDQCPARFKSVTLMRIHKNRHRAPQYTFKCVVCDNSFARRRNVARHLLRIHGLAPEQQHINRLKIG